MGIVVRCGESKYTLKEASFYQKTNGFLPEVLRDGDFAEERERDRGARVDLRADRSNSRGPQKSRGMRGKRARGTSRDERGKRCKERITRATICPEVQANRERERESNRRETSPRAKSNFLNLRKDLLFRTFIHSFISRIL